MSRISYAAAALMVMSSAAFAAEMSAEAITKAVDGVSNDPAKVTAYCAMAKKLDEISDDEKAAEVANAEIKTLGADFEAAWASAQESPEDSPQGKAFDEAMSKLDDKCDK